MLQWLALLSMVADHTDKLLHLNSPVLLTAGRFAFPVFAFLVARNVDRSHDPVGYIQRMVLWGLIAQPVFMLAFAASGFRFNVLFSLALIATACLALRQDRIWLLVACLVAAIWCDYGILGCVFGLFCYVAIRAPQWWPAAVILAVGFTPLLWWWVVCLAVLCCWLSLYEHSLLDWRPSTNTLRWIQSRFFYLFYPAHLALLVFAAAIASP